MQTDVVVVGGGIGGMCAAIMLAAKGRRVILCERASALGGKAGAQTVDGVEFDTGPSVLTLPHVFDEVFSAAGTSTQNELTLVTSSPAFRYVYPDGVSLDVHHDLEDTLTSVAQTLGPAAAREMRKYLQYSAEIWQAAAPHFVMTGAPEVTQLLLGGFRTLGLVSKIDPWSTLQQSIEKRVKSPHLRMLLQRYATYNGSDVRSAPATLGCIAHVELALGGFGVRGGMRELVRALERSLRRVGVEVLLDASVSEITAKKGRVTGITLASGAVIAADQVIANADVGHVVCDLLQEATELKAPSPLSMSAFTGVFRARRREDRVAHTVVFPRDYEAEFADIFDAHRPPRDPTIYVCAQEACHGRPGWVDEEPLFAMMNAPPVGDGFSGDAPHAQELVRRKLIHAGLVRAEDPCVWWRTPRMLAEAFPGSRGALYGAASNDMSAAFRRPKNRVKAVKGLFLASGSAHPGGGVPMVAQSGKQAALEALAQTIGESAA